jgi:hypothetical protein
MRTRARACAVRGTVDDGNELVIDPTLAGDENDAFVSDERDDRDDRDEEEDDNKDEDDEDERMADVSDTVLWNDPSRKPREHVCPFSYGDRKVLCTQTKDKKRRDLIERHLSRIKLNGYDDAHPQDDPMWQSWLVQKYYLVPRCKYDPQTRKTRQRAISKKSYRSRKERQERNLHAWKSQYDAGEITAEQFKKRLVGKARRDFDAEQELQAKLAMRWKELEERRGLGGKDNATLSFDSQTVAHHEEKGRRKHRDSI